MLRFADDQEKVRWEADRRIRTLNLEGCLPTGLVVVNAPFKTQQCRTLAPKPIVAKYNVVIS